MVGGRLAAGGVGLATLLRQRLSPGFGAQHNGPARSSGFLQQGGQAGGQIARGVGMRAQLDHRRRETYEMHGVQQVSVQQQFALGGGQGQHVAEAGQARRGRFGWLGHRQGNAARNRAHVAAATTTGGGR